MIIAVVNNKGGVGKTTTAVNLAAALAARKQRVLLADLDSQGSASLSLGVPRTQLAPSMADVLLDGLPLKRAIRQTAVSGLDLATGAMSLANADLALANVRGRERHLDEALAPACGDYDYVLLDCPPSMSLLPVNALVAADAYIVPVTPHYLALEGLVNLMEAVARLRDGMGAGARLLGLLLTMVDYRARANAEVAEMIREHYGEEVFAAEIRVNVRLTEAPSFGRTIFEHDAKCNGALGYKQLADEVLRRSRREATWAGSAKAVSTSSPRR